MKKTSEQQGLALEWLIVAALPVAVLALGVFFWSQSAAFLSQRNLIAISVQIAAQMTIAIPFAMLLMSGKVDLSVGSLLGLCGVVAGLSFESYGVSGAIVITLLTGLGVGLINGFLVAGLSMSPIIITLGGLTFFSRAGAMAFA